MTIHFHFINQNGYTGPQAHTPPASISPITKIMMVYAKQVKQTSFSENPTFCFFISNSVVTWTESFGFWKVNPLIMAKHPRMTVDNKPIKIEKSLNDELVKYVMPKLNPNKTTSVMTMVSKFFI